MTKATMSFIVSTIATLAVFNSTPASATYQQNYPAFMCKAVSGGNYTDTDVGQISNENSDELGMICPLVSNETTMSAAGVYFYSNGYNSFSIAGNAVSVSAAVCQTYSTGGGTGGACGAYSTYGGSAGVGSMTSIDTSEYSNSAFNYMLILLGEQNSGSYNTLFGYVTVLSGS
jgi:hypothetical protein